MSSQARVGETTDRKEGMVMSSHGDRLGTRLAAWGAALLLAFALAGDRGRAATVPATVYGQDPLEVLELKVRPNVMIVLDTSGSMKWGVKAPANPTNNYYPPQGGDHPRSKIWQARNVLNQIVQDNQDQVSFLFAQYDQTEREHRHAEPGGLHLRHAGREPLHVLHLLLQRRRLPPDGEGRDGERAPEQRSARVGDDGERPSSPS